LDWANFQVMRRTHSSLMNELMVDPKLVADQLGHTVDVNQNVYTKAALHRRQKAVKLLDEALAKSLVEPNGATGKKKKS
jgi:integrase